MNKTNQTKSIAALLPSVLASLLPERRHAPRATVRFYEGDRPCIEPEAMIRLQEKLRPANGHPGGYQFLEGPRSLTEENASIRRENGGK